MACCKSALLLVLSDCAHFGSHKEGICSKGSGSDSLAFVCKIECRSNIAKRRKETREIASNQQCKRGARGVGDMPLHIWDMR